MLFWDSEPPLPSDISGRKSMQITPSLMKYVVTFSLSSALFLANGHKIFTEPVHQEVNVGKIMLLVT